MIKPQTIGPNDDVCVICGGCMACLVTWPVLGAMVSSVALG